MKITQFKPYNFSTAFDLPEQSIIKIDSERTRGGDLTASEQLLIEQFLTTFCKEQKIQYKQGLNEICAPFLLMIRDGVSDCVAYNLFQQFVVQHLTTMFSDNVRIKQDFRPLQAFFLIFRLVLRYHEPRLSAFFQMNRISPELYSSSWFLTAFAFKLSNIEVLYELWEDMLSESDPLFLVYVSVAFLQHVTHLIIDKEDYLVAQAITQLNFDSMEELHLILPKARFVKKNMPYSIFVRLVNFNIYNLDTINYSIKALEKEFCLTVPPQEVMIRAYPETKICSCKFRQCAWCVKRGKDLPLIILDCRQGKVQSQGVFPNTCLVEPYLYEDVQSILDFPDRYMEIRGIFHFCLMGSKDFYKSSFDIQEKLSLDSDKTQMVIENLLQAFLVKGFPYVSLVEGGFEKCHDFAMSYDLPLDNHQERSCKICNPTGSKFSFLLKKKFKLPLATGSRNRSTSSKENQVYEFDDVDTGLYRCKYYDKSSKSLSEEDYEIAINRNHFTVGVVRNFGGESKTILYHGRLENLFRIRCKNKEKRFVGFYFTDCSKSLFFEFFTYTDARTCISQATKYCGMLSN